MKSQASVELQFNFDRVPWRDVIKWVAQECELALHFEDLPPGSFSYADSQGFSPTEAIDRVNLFLLPQGYSLVRSGKLLSVINLSDPRSMKQLDALAPMVRADQLTELQTHDVVKCLFALEDLEAEEAVEELSVLELMTQPSVFSKTNQLMITDTVSKLKNVQAILEAFKPSTLNNGTVMKTFPLKHVSAEDILLVARPHLGLATGEMIGIDVSLSADLQGEYIFVTGVEDKVSLIEGLVQALDVEDRRLSREDGSAELRSHLVRGGNVETVYDVLQTLLAGRSLRLSIDEASSSIVALASPEIQKEIEQTVAQLEASEADFEVIPLNSVDPYYAISLLEEMLDLTEDPDAPKIDADPGNMRLYVRAKRPQIEQIKKIVLGLDGSGTSGSASQLRVLPIRGKRAEEVLTMAAKFWRMENPIVLYPEQAPAADHSNERSLHRKGPKARLTGSKLTSTTTATPRYLTDNLRSSADAIRCQLTPNGLILQSEDTAALDQFEKHIRTIDGPGEDMPSPPIVYYLKYTRPEDALRMLAELLDGGESAKVAEAGSLVNGFVGSSGSFLGSIVVSRDGTSTLIADSLTVVSDSRLNRLIAQGTESDIQTIEAYLKIIDKDKSITTIETHGITEIVELKYTNATEVAATIRESYSGRMESSKNVGGSAGQVGQGRDPNGGNRDEDSKNDKKSLVKKGATPSQPPRDLSPKMTVAVHETSNSLIITAPADLLKEVVQVVNSIDSRSEQVVEVVSSVNAPLIEAVLVPGGSGSTRRSSTTNSSSRSSEARYLQSLRSKSTR